MLDRNGEGANTDAVENERYRQLEKMIHNELVHSSGIGYSVTILPDNDVIIPNNSNTILGTNTINPAYSAIINTGSNAPWRHPAGTSYSSTKNMQIKDPVKTLTDNLLASNNLVKNAEANVIAKRNALNNAKQAVAEQQKRFDTAPAGNPAMFPHQPSPKQFHHDKLLAEKRKQTQAQSEYDRAVKEKDKIVEHRDSVQAEFDTVKDAVKLTADFYKDLFNKYGENSEKIAKELAETAKGRLVRNREEALKAFDKFRDAFNRKYSVADREAIARSLESLTRENMAKNLARFGKAFGLVSFSVDAYDIVNVFRESQKTDNWRPFFVKIESLAAGMAASYVTAFAFSIILGSPLGVLGFAVIMAAVSALVNEKFMEDINKLIGI